MKGFSKEGPVEWVVKTAQVNGFLKKMMDKDHTLCAATKLEAGKQLSIVERVLKRGTS